MPPLTIWAVTDGRAGIQSQALGLAEAVSRQRQAHIVVKRVAWPRWMKRVPSACVVAPLKLLDPSSDAIEAPWPDLWIANGRAAIPLSIGVRGWSQRHSFVVQIQDPLRSAKLFDLVLPPTHDELHGPNVFPITGTPHRVTPERLADAYAAFAARIEAWPGPRVVVLIGGKSRAYDLSPKRAARLAEQIAGAVTERGASLYLTFSRRTPDAAKSIMTERLSGLPGMIWNGEGENPYFAFLAAADFILVTEDSANMPAEAAATGKPVYLLKMDGAQARKTRFHAELSSLGISRPFEGVLESWTYPPLRETDRAATEILRRMGRL